MLIDYLYTNTDAIICYHVSEMIIKIVSDTAFLVLPQSRILAAAIYHLGRKNKIK